jgi:RNA polymerase sigma-70 factor, ECF subfamily
MDADLIRRAQQGDRDAFRQLYERYAGVALKTAWALLAQRMLAEDVTQEVWLEVWRHLATFQSGKPFKPWLLAIVVNRSRNAAQRQRTPAMPLSDEGLDEPADAADVEQTYMRLEEDAELRRAFVTLPLDQRQVIELRYFAELDVAEIAAALHIPIGTVKSRLHRALAALRLRLPAASVQEHAP